MVLLRSFPTHSDRQKAQRTASMAGATSLRGAEEDRQQGAVRSARTCRRRPGRRRKRRMKVLTDG